MNKFDTFNVLSQDLINNQIPFSVIQDDALRIVTQKANVTIKTNGVAMLKTNEQNAFLTLAQNNAGKIREIWSGETVKNYSSTEANIIVKDILNL